MSIPIIAQNAHARGLSRMLWGLLALLLLLPARPSVAQQGAGEMPYRLGPGDILQLSVWQMPELDRTLTVDENGRITVPLIGEVRADERLPSEIEGEIVERIQVYHRNISRVSVEVMEYNSKAFYVLGAVLLPGRYSMWPMPNVWQAIREAGGIGPDGDLSRVRVYRQREGLQVLENYDLEAMLEREGALDLPPLEAGETVEVPRRPADPAAYQGRDGIYVYGQVLRPGVYRLEAGSRDVLGLILQAGGPLSDADMGKVLLLRNRPDGSLFRFEMNLDEYLADADGSNNPGIQGGDTIFVPRETPVMALIRSNLAVLTTIGTLLTTVILLRNN